MTILQLKKIIDLLSNTKSFNNLKKNINKRKKIIYFVQVMTL